MAKREGRGKVYPRRGESGRAGDEVAAGAATDGVGAGAPRVEGGVRRTEIGVRGWRKERL